MPKIAKAYAITDAKISFVSLVDKAANKKQFLITKSEDGAANFATFGRILKADADSHFVTGIVYEPMVEDTQGNYMTEEEITKAAYWFAKNGNQVDLQHCFKKCDGAEVVESYVAKCDMEIEGETIKKGTWLMTMEITDSDVWDSIQKGDITGFSMGGVGVYSEEDVELPVEKQEEPKGLFRKLAKAMGFDVVEKGAVKNNFKRRVKEDNANAELTQTESANEFIYSGKLQLPAGTDVRVNDKVVDKNTGLAYTAEMPHNIRDHHIMVNIQRKGTVKGAFLCFFVREVLVLFHCIKECFVKLVTPAVFTITDFKSLIDQILPSCHETYQSSERCRCVIGSVNMDVNTTAAMGFCSVLAELSYNDLQELNVFIVEGWCNHFYSVFIHRSI